MGRGGGKGGGRGGATRADEQPESLKDAWDVFLVNDGYRYLFIAFWFTVNFGLFIGMYMKFSTADEFARARTFLGESLPVARGSASVLNLNCALILLPVCRNLISLIRGCVRGKFIRILDKNIVFHKCCAWTMIFFAIVHAMSHLYNVVRLSRAGGPDNQVVFTGVPWNTSTSFIAFSTWAGATGQFLMLILFLMITSSVEQIRRPFFEVFWFTHHLFVPFFILGCLHGIGELVHKDILIIGPGGETETASVGLGANFWKWAVGPMCLYAIERILRFYRSQCDTPIMKVVAHPSKTMEIQMRKEGFRCEPGQYIFLHCPSVSRLEWHPFTLSSAPEDENISVHIRCVGDWTNELSKQLGITWGDESQEKPLDTRKLPRVAVDGPFGTPTEDVFKYEHVVCVGAGIGVTPFASVLKSIWYKSLANPDLPIKKVYFYWLCRDKTAFEWFSDLLDALDEQMLEYGRSGFLEVNVYLTGRLKADEIQNVVMHQEDERDAISGLRAKTNYGRPRWDVEFQRIKDESLNKDVGVMFCGPKVLASKLNKECNKYTDRNTKFYFSKENF